MRCPKCGYERKPSDQAPDYECPACGIVYSKFKKKQSLEYAYIPPKLTLKDRLINAFQKLRLDCYIFFKTSEPALRLPGDRSGNVGWPVVLMAAVMVIFFIRDNLSKPPRDSHPVGAVSNSGWDGSVWQVEQYLKDNLKDPRSLEVIEWSNVAKQSDGGYIVRCKYRARNSFGGYVIEEKAFVLSSVGIVINVLDMSR